MEHKFRYGKTIYLVIIFVFIIGLLIEIINSNFILRYLPRTTILNDSNDLPVMEFSKKTIENINAEEYLLIYNEENMFSQEIKENIKQTLEYMKKNVEVLTFSETPSSFKRYKNVIIAFEELSKLPHLKELEEYAANGGKVFLAIRPEINNSLQNFYRKLGIYEVGEFIYPDGMEFLSNVLLMQDGLVMKKGDISENSSLQLGLDDSTTIYIQSSDRVPLLWDIPFQKGKFMVFNGSILSGKENRGLIAGALSLLNENFIYPVMNMKVAFIDDFPAPIPEGKNKEIFAEFKRDIPSFYQDIWWRGMIRLAANYDIKYTGVAIQTYNDRVIPPFEDDANHHNTFVQFGRELLKMGGEIGIHGYNHQSLVVDQKAVDDLGYKAWRKQEDMENSIKTVEQYIEKWFPNYKINTYVPPSNRIDSNGENALKNAVPSIHIIASLYLKDDVEYTTVHEFDQKGGYIKLPRITSGYEYTNKMRWAMVNGITSIGVFNHFIQPDDVLDIERSSNKNWGDLKNEFEEMLRDVNEKYSWLQSKTASQAGKELSHYLDANVFVEEFQNNIIVHIDHFAGEMGFLFRTNKKIGKLKNCMVKKVDKDVYYIEAKKEMFEIGLVD